MKETDLIQWIAKKVRHPPKNLKVGIGDDCSVFTLGKKEILVTCDALIEGIHFKKSWGTWKEWGKKAAGSALSDIAAMGGTPQFGWSQLSLPKGFSKKGVLEFYDGVLNVFKKFHVTLAGGNTCKSPKGFSATLVIQGERPKGVKMLRSSAKLGDFVYIGGPVGWAGRGLELLSRQLSAVSCQPSKFIKAFLNPQPQIALGRWLAKNKIANACIDVSDGLLKDLNHIAQASKVKICIQAPKSSLTDLTAGEDYILAFTVPPSKEKWVAGKRGLVKIGVVQKGKPGIEVRDPKGRKLRFRKLGYDSHV